MIMNEPRSGSVRINDGPWLPCGFTLNGTNAYVEWTVDTAMTGGWPMPGPAEVEISICPGVSVFGSVIITDVSVSTGGAILATLGSGSLRGTR